MGQLSLPRGSTRPAFPGGRPRLESTRKSGRSELPIAASRPGRGHPLARPKLRSTRHPDVTARRRGCAPPGPGQPGGARLPLPCQHSVLSFTPKARPGRGTRSTGMHAPGTERGVWVSKPDPPVSWKSLARTECKFSGLSQAVSLPGLTTMALLVRVRCVPSSSRPRRSDLGPTQLLAELR